MESGVGREEEEERGEGRSGGREGNRGGGKREPKRRDGDADWGPGGGGDRFVYGQWGEGRGRREEPGEGRGFAALLPAWDSGGTSLLLWLSPRSPLCLQRPSPASFLAAPKERGVETHFSSWPTWGGGP